MAVYTPPEYTDYKGLQFALDLIEGIYFFLTSEKNKALESPYMSVTTKEELEVCCRPGNRGFMLFVEGGTPLRGSIKNLHSFYQLGVRGMTITHNFDNELAKGCFSEESKRGLTEFGRQAVQRMDELGMVIDLAHSNESTFWETLELTKNPVIDSHTGLRHYVDFPRNLTDEQVKAVGRNGGVVCLSFLPAQHKEGTDKGAEVTVSDIADAVFRVIDLAGIDHVGLGSDWDGFGGLVKGLEDIAGLSNLTEEFIRRKMSEEDIAKILGANMIRVFNTVLRE
jgi:membrane dipeptidase